MPRDRLEEFKLKATFFDRVKKGRKKKEKEIVQTLSTVENLQAGVRDLRATLDEANKLLNSLFLLTRGEEKEIVELELEKTFQNFLPLCIAVKEEFRALTDKGSFATPQHGSILNTQLSSLCTVFREIVADYSEVSNLFQNWKRQKVYFESAIKAEAGVQAVANWEELLVTDSETSETDGKVKVNSEEDCFKEEVLNLEKNLKELHSLFKEMGLFLETQGETLQSITTDINSANQNVEKGTEHLKTAKKEKRKFWWVRK